MAEFSATSGPLYHGSYLLGAVSLTAAMAGMGIYGLLGGAPAALGLTASAALGVIVVLDALTNLQSS